MNITSTTLDKIVWVITVFLFSSITIFESYTWGKYLLIIACIMIFIIDVFKQNGKYHFSFGKFHGFMLLLSIYTIMSAAWGISVSDCFTKAFTFVQIFICMGVVYNYYVKSDNVTQLVSIIKWSSYIISIYSIFYYGYDFIVSMMKSGTRLDNTYSNVNTIGMLAAIGIIIQADEIVRNRKFSVEAVLAIPSLIMVIATQSRKALLMLIIGVLLVLIFRNLKNKKFFQNVLKIVAILIVVAFLLRYFSTMEIFEGINTRMMYLFAMFTGEGEVGASAMLRQQLIDLGINIFRQNPLVGIGIGCPHIIADQQLHFDAYLHNGFVEMLAAGGLVGFCIYYGSYIYLLWNFYRNRKGKDENYVLCIVLSLILLFRDYAMVAVYDKSMYFYFMILFLEVKNLKMKKENFV